MFLLNNQDRYRLILSLTLLSQSISGVAVFAIRGARRWGNVLTNKSKLSVVAVSILCLIANSIAFVRVPLLGPVGRSLIGLPQRKSFRRQPLSSFFSPCRMQLPRDSHCAVVKSVKGTRSAAFGRLLFLLKNCPFQSLSESQS